MSKQRFTPEFKEDAVRQIVERGYSVAEVSSRLGVSSHSLYHCVKSVKPDKTEKQAAELSDAKSEILKLRAQLHRTEGRTRHSMSTGMNSRSRRCAVFCRWRARGSISGYTSSYLIARSRSRLLGLIRDSYAGSGGM
jgi:transposase